jgi:serine/threonine protein kinase
MEYVDGDSLSSLKTKQPGGCFGVSEIARWVGHFCLALDYAHRQARVVHRDLKPANLMINSRGDLKITDFGISRSLSDSMTRVSQSNSAGTLAYMSPEQALGSSPAPADDIYAFGATLYDLLTGRPPFFRGNLQVQLENVMPPPMMQRRAELEHEAEPIPELWEEVVRSCLAKRPEDRPQSLLEVGHTLGLLGPSTTPSRPLPKPAEPAPAPPSVRMPKTTKHSVTSLDEILGVSEDVPAPSTSTSRPASDAVVKTPAQPAAAPVPPESPPQRPTVPPQVQGRRALWPLWVGAAAALVMIAVFIAMQKPRRETAAVSSTPSASTPAPTPAPATPDPERVAADKLASACEQAIAKGDFTAARRDLATLEAFSPPDPRAAGLRGRLVEAETHVRQAELTNRLSAAEKAIAARNAPAAREAIARVLEIQDDPRLAPLRQALAQLEAPPPSTPAPPPAATPVRPPSTARDDNRRPPDRKKPTPAPVRPAREERVTEPPAVRATPPSAPPAATPRRTFQGAPGT